MSKERCDHPDCKGSKKKYQRLQLHKAIVHEGKKIGAAGDGTKKAPTGSDWGDGMLGGQVSRAVDRNIDPQTGRPSGILPADYTGTKNEPAKPSTFGILDEAGKPVHIIRFSGLRAVRKVGDHRRYDPAGRQL